MTLTVPNPIEIKPVEEWRVGLVTHADPDHVHGVTALTPAEWVALDARPHGVFVVSERCAHTGEHVMDHHRHLSHAGFFAELHRLIELTPAAFEPQRGPFRLVVKEIR